LRVTGRIWKEQINPDGACIPNLCSWARETIEKKKERKKILCYLAGLFQSCHVVMFSLVSAVAMLYQ
jgi:hypothetical protein